MFGNAGLDIAEDRIATVDLSLLNILELQRRVDNRHSGQRIKPRFLRLHWRLPAAKLLRINDQQHKGLLKIGNATLQTATPIDSLAPNSKELNQAARKRIKQYTNTAGNSWELLHTELAVRMKTGKDGSSVLVPFRDHDVHRVLTNSRIKKKQPKLHLLR